LIVSQLYQIHWGIIDQRDMHTTYTSNKFNRFNRKYKFY
jgi:hypothetical protein